VCMYTAKDHLVTLPCAYTRQSLHVAHTYASWERAGVLPGPLPCELGVGRTAKGAGGRTAMTTARHRFGKGLTHGNGLGARQRLDPQQRRMTHNNAGEARQRLCRPYVARRTAKGALPGMTLPCGLCRASTHDNAFVMPLAHTAKHAFPVVLGTPF
jgi:hypothetical protein